MKSHNLTEVKALQSSMLSDGRSCKFQAWSTTHKHSQRGHTGPFSAWKIRFYQWWLWLLLFCTFNPLEWNQPWNVAGSGIFVSWVDVESTLEECCVNQARIIVDELEEEHFEGVALLELWLGPGEFHHSYPSGYHLEDEPGRLEQNTDRSYIHPL